MNETNNKDDLNFWINPHNIYYRIYLCYDEHGKRTEKYRLIEEDDWDEFHKVDILNNATYEQIFMLLDIMGKRDKLRGNYYLEP